MRRLQAGITGVLAGIVVGLGSFGGAGAQAEDSSVGVDLRTCGVKPFPLSVFSEPGGYQKEDTGIAAALRHEIATDDMTPKLGWRLVARGKNWAELVAGKPKREGNTWLEFHREKGKWRFWSGWYSCWFSAYRPDASAGEWFVAEGQRLSPSTRSLKVDVYEVECNSGKPAWGRITAPRILYREDWIVVTYFVRYEKGSTFETCPSNPPLTKTLKLDESLGDRTILDGGTYPYPRRYPSRKRTPFG